MKLQDVFTGAPDGKLTWEEFKAAMEAGGAKFVDLSEGNYVSKRKYDDDIAGRDSQITTLNDTIAQRDTDLTEVRSQLEAAGADVAKLGEVTGNLKTLQDKYNADTQSFKAQLKKQAYEFAVREYAAGKKFTSQAAKRDFIQTMIAKELKMEKDSILGADDFVAAYSKDNADAFVTEEEPTPAPATPKPQFVSPTPGGQPAPIESNAFAQAFNFTGVRPHDN